MKHHFNLHTSDVIELSIKDIIKLIFITELKEGSMIVKRKSYLFSIEYGWTRISKNGIKSEGGYSRARRLIGKLFFGEKYKKYVN